MPYLVTIDGKSWMTDELNLKETCEIEAATGVDWSGKHLEHGLEPVYSARLARAFYRTFLSRDMTPADAKKRVGAMTIDEALACISLADGESIWKSQFARYRITFDGQSWLTEELTLDEACAVEEETGASWLVMQPVNSARHARAILSRFLARKYGATAAALRVDTMLLKDIKACVTAVQQDAPAPSEAVAGDPKADQDLETPDSSETPPQG